MRTLATLQKPDSGSITLDGVDALADPDYVRPTGPSTTTPAPGEAWAPHAPCLEDVYHAAIARAGVRDEEAVA